MASLRDIRDRIDSVKNTQKITSAMKMVSAAKLRKSQEAMEQARPYSVELGGLLARLSARMQEEKNKVPHPLMKVRREVKRVMLVVMTSDRGLCGSYNTSNLRRAERFLRENANRFEEIEIATVGRKGFEYFGKRHVSTVTDHPGVFEDLTFRRALEIADGLSKAYMDDHLDGVYLLYNKFQSVMNQEIILQDLLPIVQSELPEGEEHDYLYEPDRFEVLETLVPRHVAVCVWQALLESQASEYGARMTAMDSATKNAGELVDSLTLEFNRARQAAITMELMDIVGGAEALNG